METTRLSSKGQVIIPKHIRDAKQWHIGTEFIVEDVGNGILLKPRLAKPFPESDPEQGLGCSGYTGSALSQEDIDTALDEDLRRRWMQE